jgi:hypothetical protein
MNTLIRGTKGYCSTPPFLAIFGFFCVDDYRRILFTCRGVLFNDFHMKKEPFFILNRGEGLTHVSGAIIVDTKIACNHLGRQL